MAGSGRSASEWSAVVMIAAGRRGIAVIGISVVIIGTGIVGGAASDSLSDGIDNHQQNYYNNDTDNNGLRNAFQKILESGHVFGGGFLTGRGILSRIVIIMNVFIGIDITLTFYGVQSLEQRLLDVIGIDGLTAFGQVFVHHIQDLVPFGIRIDRLCIIGSPYVIISGRIALEIKIDKHSIGGTAKNGIGTVTGELLRFRIGSVVAAEEYRNIHIQIISGTLNFFPHISFHAGRENVGLVLEKGTTGTVGALHRSRDIRPQIIEIGFGDNRIGGLNRYAEQTTQTKG